MSLQVKVKKLSPNAVMPKQADSGSAGMDLVATSMKAVLDKDTSITYLSYGTSLAFEIPEGYVGLLFPRSSISNQTNLTLANSVGVIDSSYRGEVSFRFRSVPGGVNRNYKIGDRIGQLVIIPYPKVIMVESEELSETERGTGGYGSSGK